MSPATPRKRRHTKDRGFMLSFLNVDPRFLFAGLPKGRLAKIDRSTGLRGVSGGVRRGLYYHLWVGKNG